MASLNPLTRELVFKIVFYGPGLGGKTTTLQYIHATTKPEHRGKMVSLATPMDRTLYFDFLPLRVPRVRGMSVRLQLFTVPGQVYYGATRKLVLTGADGVVFVADSQAGREDANKESLEDLITNLAEHNRPLSSVPHTFHYNKRDLSEVVPIDELDQKFNPQGAPSLGTVATRGEGVFEGLERITRLVLRAYEAELPRSDRGEGTTRHDSEEIGIADAIRGLTESSHRPKQTPHAGMKAVRSEPTPFGSPSSLESIPSPIPRRQPSSPDLSAAQLTAAQEASLSSSGYAASGGGGPARLARIALASSVVEAGAAGAGHNASPAARAREVDAGRARDVEERGPDTPPPQTRVPTGEDIAAELRPSAGLGPVAPVAPSSATGSSSLVVSKAPEGQSPFSLAELWADGERETARDVEVAIAARDGATAVLGCDVLVTRILASTAGLSGNADAPRDPGMVALLLGLDGRRYLAFRAAVRAARLREGVTMKDALDAYTFALEARRAREAIGR